jgi:hypothetical protein
MESKERSEFTEHSLWAFEPLFDGLRQGRDLLLLARLSARGIYQLEERYDHLQQFAEFSEHFVYEDESFKTVMKTYTLGNNHYLRLPQDKLAIELEHAADGAEAAREERARNYAGINNQTFVSAWGMLEDTIRIFLVKWLANRPDARCVATSSIDKVKLSEYDPLDEEGKLFFIVERLILKGGGKGANRFENLLKPFDLSGPVDEDLKPSVGDGKPYGCGQTLFDAHYLLDVLVHRRGIIDRKTAEACPSIGYKAGDPVRFTEAGLEVYVIAILEYIGLVIRRVANKLEVDHPELNLDYILTKDWKIGNMR